MVACTFSHAARAGLPLALWVVMGCSLDTRTPTLSSGAGAGGDAGALGAAGEGAGQAGSGQAGSGQAGSDAQDGGVTGPATSVEETLARLGVDIEPSPRVSALGTGLPATYTPLGTTAELGRIDELFTLGIEFPAQASFAQVIERETGSTQFLNSPAPSAVWIDGKADAASGEFTLSPRTAVAADVDGDGREELLILYVDAADPAHDQELMLIVREDSLHSTPYAETAPRVLAVQAGVVDVTAAAGDFNGDGRDELAVGLGLDSGAGARLLFITNEGGSLALNAAATQQLAPVNANAPLSLMLEAGQLDFDAGDELGVVENEYIDNANAGSGLSTWHVFDDASSEHAELGTGGVSGIDGGTFSAIVADLATGDIDGDGLEELLLGGLVAYTASGCQEHEYIFVALDDHAHGLAPLGADYQSVYPSGCSDVSPDAIRWVHVNALDLNGDGADELHMNEHVYSSFADAAPFTPLSTLGADAVLYDDSDNGVVYNRSSSAFAVADVTGDGRQDLLAYGQGNDQAIFIFRVDESGAFGPGGQLDVVDRPTNPAGFDVPLIVPVNIDDDSVVLKVSEPAATSGAGLPGAHQLVFTEPIVHTVLAAAPCAEGIGQNVGECGTLYGSTPSPSATLEQVLSVSVRPRVDLDTGGVPLTQGVIALSAELLASVTQRTRDAYPLTQSIAYSTGSLEDSVIFTTVPYDTWQYELTSHPDPDLVGRPISIAVPRKPLTLIAERELFNGALQPGKLQIGSNLLQHTPGVLESYPSLADKSALLSQHGGLSTPVQAVGSGNGKTELVLAVGAAHASGAALEVGYTLELEATSARRLGGFSIGSGADASLTVESGSETRYTGVVGRIDSQRFADNAYGFGLFAYVLAVGGQELEIVNYWVE